MYKMPEGRDCQNPPQLGPQPRCNREPAILILTFFSWFLWFFVCSYLRIFRLRAWSFISFANLHLSSHGLHFNKRATTFGITKPETWYQDWKIVVSFASHLQIAQLAPNWPKHKIRNLSNYSSKVFICTLDIAK